MFIWAASFLLVILLNLFNGSIHRISNRRTRKAVKVFFEALDVVFEKKSGTIDKLSDDVIKGIAEGQADYEAGSTTTLEEFKKKLMIFK